MSFEIKTLPQYRAPSGNTSSNVRVLVEDGRIVLVDRDHEFFDRIVAGKKK